MGGRCAHSGGHWATADSPQTGAAGATTACRLSFTGTLHGGQISIVTNGILGSTSTWTGTLAGDTLTLNMPQDNGSIAPVTFTRGQVTAYNSAVSKFQAQVTQERAQAASDAASASANADADAASASDTAGKSWNAKVATYVAAAHTLATQASAIADAAAKAVR